MSDPTLGDLLSEAEERRPSLTVYGAVDSALLGQFETRNVTVERRPLPEVIDEEFVVLRDGDRFRCAIGRERLDGFLSPPIRAPWDLDLLPPEYRSLFELLDDTVFGSLNRRQLLAASRELEGQAYRRGRGTLRVGFQSVVAFREQEPTYRRLADETDLDVHVYAVPDAPTDDLPVWPATFHTEPAEQIGRYWFLLFDASEDDTDEDDTDEDEWSFALVAEEREAGTFSGFWTFERAIVDRAVRTLA
ncbi:DICT sensory domain-containing protein [Halorarum halobium]|uniref:DICT sensory domain-containing protein n=1 Tax=Halorarum halobium TaxID=3075121 RepID=UPI0028AAB9D1|nr:DICT sensory domain-containing protein [Halobaculum sp. XH14]